MERIILCYLILPGWQYYGHQIIINYRMNDCWWLVVHVYVGSARLLSRITIVMIRHNAIRWLPYYSCIQCWQTQHAVCTWWHVHPAWYSTIGESVFIAMNILIILMSMTPKVVRTLKYFNAAATKSCDLTMILLAPNKFNLYNLLKATALVAPIYSCFVHSTSQRI